MLNEQINNIKAIFFHLIKNSILAYSKKNFDKNNYMKNKVNNNNNPKKKILFNNNFEL